MTAHFCSAVVQHATGGSRTIMLAPAILIESLSVMGFYCEHLDSVRNAALPLVVRALWVDSRCSPGYTGHGNLAIQHHFPPRHHLPPRQHHFQVHQQIYRCFTHLGKPGSYRIVNYKECLPLLSDFDSESSIMYRTLGGWRSGADNIKVPIDLNARATSPVSVQLPPNLIDIDTSNSLPEPPLIRKLPNRHVYERMYRAGERV